MNVSTYFGINATQKVQLAEKMVEAAELQVDLARRNLKLAKADALSNGAAARVSKPEIKPSSSRDKLLQIAHCLYKGRRDREKHFAADLFSEPAWDMLLDLFIGELNQKKTPVTSLCVASGVPTTTALRYIKSLEAAGFVMREASTTDARIVFLSLTPDAYSRMLACIEAQASRLGI